MAYVIALIALVLGLVIGERFPDLDQRTELLLHRSIITHGLLLPLFLYLLASNNRLMAFRWFVMGVAQGVAVHLVFDLFPRAWNGYALVSLPILGWLPALLSWAWIAFGCVVCLFLAGKLVRSCQETSLFLLGVVAIFAYAALGEDALWRPMAALVVAMLAASTALGATFQSRD